MGFLFHMWNFSDVMQVVNQRTSVNVKAHLLTLYGVHTGLVQNGSD